MAIVIGATRTCRKIAIRAEPLGGQSIQVGRLASVSVTLFDEQYISLVVS